MENPVKFSSKEWKALGQLVAAQIEATTGHPPVRGEVVRLLRYRQMVLGMGLLSVGLDEEAKRFWRREGE